MSYKQPERWKKIKFPKGFDTKANYQISNYGRVRNLLPDGSFNIKKGIIHQNQLVYKFNFPANKNDGKRLILHQKANHLVARHFCKEYFEGCHVVWANYNRLDNFHKNLLCLPISEARSHVAKGRKLEVPQVAVEPPNDEEVNNKKGKKQHEENGRKFFKVEYDDEFFKTIPECPDYEISRFGIIRRCRAPFVGRIMKQRLHPDGFYFLDVKDANKKRVTLYPHKEVAKLWNINIQPETKTIVVHLDGDTTNNCSDNLEWVDHSEALKLQFKQGKRNNFKVWEKRKALYGNGFKNR